MTKTRIILVFCVTKSRDFRTRNGFLGNKHLPLLSIKDIGSETSLFAAAKGSNPVPNVLNEVHDGIPVPVVGEHGNDEKGAEHWNDPEEE